MKLIKFNELTKDGTLKGEIFINPDSVVKCEEIPHISACNIYLCDGSVSVISKKDFEVLGIKLG